LTVERLSGAWRLARLGGHWRLEAHALEIGAPASAPATLSVDAATDAAWAHGTLQSAPLPVVAAIARWYAPQLPLAQVALSGAVRELAFDWNAGRPGGVRLRTSAQLENVTLATPSRDMVLTGLNAHVAFRDADVALLARLLGARALAAFGAPAAQLIAGRIASADLEWRGPLTAAQPPWSRGGTEFRGAVGLRDATLAGSDPWPDM